MLIIDEHVSIPRSEVQISGIRASGPGGQGVNKTASAAHLRFDILASSLPGAWKQRLLQLNDERLNRRGELIIKAQDHRSFEQNRADAIGRLLALLRAAAREPPPRRPTRPGRNARRRRTDSKTRRGKLKALRAKVRDD